MEMSWWSRTRDKLNRWFKTAGYQIVPELVVTVRPKNDEERNKTMKVLTDGYIGGIKIYSDSDKIEIRIRHTQAYWHLATEHDVIKILANADIVFDAVYTSVERYLDVRLDCMAGQLAAV